jgi:hypothetical protein
MPSRTIDTTVDINADRDAVWDVLTDFASYKEWNPVMRIEGAPEVGTKLVVWRSKELSGSEPNSPCAWAPTADAVGAWSSSRRC